MIQGSKFQDDSASLVFTVKGAWGFLSAVWVSRCERERVVNLNIVPFEPTL